MANVTNAEWEGGNLAPFRFAGGPPVDQKKCDGKHYIYVAEVVYVQKDGMLHVVNVCRACGQVTFHAKKITSEGVPAVFLQNKEKENKNEL